MGRPFVAIIIAYVAGLLCAQMLQPPLALLFGAAFVLLLLTLCIRTWRPILIWPLLALAGWTNYVINTTVLSPNDLRVLLGQEPAIATIRGELLETPRLKIRTQDSVEKWRGVARVKVSAIRLRDQWQPAVGTVLVNTPNLPDPQFFTGQPVEVTGVIAPPPPPLAEGLFDFQTFLAARGVWYQLKADSWHDWKLLEPHLDRPPLSDRFLKWSKETLALGMPVEDETLRLLWAMTLDWRTAFTGDISEPFLRAGTFHMFAIDGLRIGLLAGMIVTLLRAIRLSRAWAGAIAIPIIWFYTAATGWESSAVRASVMMTVILGGWALKRPSDLLNSLAAAAFIILLWDPRQVFEAGFQLSFCVVMVIAVMLKPLNDFCDRRLLADPLLPDSLRPGWQKITREILRRMAHYAALSFTAWIGSLPLCAKYFHLVNPVSTLANIVAVPLGTLALIANLGALVCGHWLTPATELFNQAAWAGMLAMTHVSEVAAQIPGAYWYVSEPSATSIVLYYALIIAVFSGWFSNRRRQLVGGAILLVIALGYGWQWESSREKTTLTVLPLNGSQAVYVHGGGRSQECLINAGNDEAVDFTLKPFLRAHGVNRLPRLVLTVGYTASAGGAPLLDDLFGIGELWTSPAKFRSAEYRSVVASFEQPPARHRLWHAGEIQCGWQMLHPADGNEHAHAEDSAMVLLGNFSGLKILLLADLGRAGQTDLLATTNDLRADIVVADLPGDGEPLRSPLLQAIQPKMILIADAEFPVTRRAKTALKERLGATGIPVIYTRTAGAATIVADPTGWHLQTMDGQTINSSAASATPPHIAPVE